MPTSSIVMFARSGATSANAPYIDLEAADARRGERPDRAGADRVDADPVRAEVRREIAHRRLERGLRHAHHVVVRDDLLGPVVGERQDRRAAPEVRGSAPRGTARRASRRTRRARARTRRATCRRTRPVRSSRFANARAWTRMSRSPCVSPSSARRRARSRRRSGRRTARRTSTRSRPRAAAPASRSAISIDEKPTSAPCAWSAWAMPQAIEWSLATPKISAFLPSSSPMPPSAGRRAAAVPRIRGPRGGPAPTGLLRLGHPDVVDARLDDPRSRRRSPRTGSGSSGPPTPTGRATRSCQLGVPLDRRALHQEDGRRVSCRLDDGTRSSSLPSTTTSWANDLAELEPLAGGRGQSDRRRVIVVRRHRGRWRTRSAGGRAGHEGESARRHAVGLLPTGRRRRRLPGRRAASAPRSPCPSRRR